MAILIIHFIEELGETAAGTGADGTAQEQVGGIKLSKKIHLGRTPSVRQEAGQTPPCAHTHTPKSPKGGSEARKVVRQETSNKDSPKIPYNSLLGTSVPLAQGQQTH